MTTDTTRDLTETELSYLGWQIVEGSPDPWPDYVLSLNGHNILAQVEREELLELANRIARAQGITPPAFQVGERVIREKYIGDDNNTPGTVIRVQWADEWLYTVRFDEPVFEGGDSECSYAAYELERLDT